MRAHKRLPQSRSRHTHAYNRRRCLIMRLLYAYLTQQVKEMPLRMQYCPHRHPGYAGSRHARTGNLTLQHPAPRRHCSRRARQCVCCTSHACHYTQSRRCTRRGSSGGHIHARRRRKSCRAQSRRNTRRCTRSAGGAQRAPARSASAALTRGRPAGGRPRAPLRARACPQVHARQPAGTWCCMPAG